MGEWRGRHRLITLDELLTAVMGEIDECRMSLYGLSKLLESRNFGPAQLLPALESLESMARRHGASVDRFSERMRVDPVLPECWRQPLHDALGEVSKVLGEIVPVVAVRGKLGAKARLELEGRISELGTRLESVRDVARAVLGASLMPPRPSQLNHVVAPGKSMASDALGVQQLWLIDRTEPMYVAPEAWCLVIEQQLRWLYQEGHHEVVLWREQPYLIEIAAGSGASVESSGDVTAEQMELTLRPSHPIEGQMAETIAQELGIQIERSPGKVALRCKRPSIHPNGQQTAV